MANERDERDNNDPTREFAPEQASGRNEPAAVRDVSKEMRDELEFAENVDPAEEALAKQRAGQRGAGITNRPLDEEEREQEKLPERNVRKASPR